MQHHTIAIAGTWASVLLAFVFQYSPTEAKLVGAHKDERDMIQYNWSNILFHLLKSPFRSQLLNLGTQYREGPVFNTPAETVREESSHVPPSRWRCRESSS